MKSIDTITSRYSPLELYNLTKDTIRNIGSGSNNAVLTIYDDVVSIQNGSILFETIKDVDNEKYVISEKHIEMYDLYLLFELFENVVDEHLNQNEEL